MAISQVAFTKPPVAGSGTSALTRAIIDRLLGNALSPQRIRHPVEGLAQLAQSALAARLMGKEAKSEAARQAAFGDTFQQFAADARGTPSQQVAPDLADITQGVELDPGGGFRTIGVPGDRQAALAAALQNRDFRSFAQTPGGGALLEQIAPLPPKAETFGQPVAGVGPLGQPAFFRVGNRGTARQVQGFRPPPKTSGGPTLSQRANNAEIRTAREAVGDATRLGAGTVAARRYP